MHNIMIGVAGSAMLVVASAFAQVPSTVEGEAIIVTGEKAGRSVQDTLTSVAVTTSERIARDNLFSVQDIYNRTVNLSETYGAAGFTIRGIANTGVGSGGTADTATVYVDGAPVPAEALFGGPTDLWDMDQVEILRGPQSTIQGLNALAGSVVMTTRDPSMDRWSSRARLIWTEYDDRSFAAALGGPLVADQIGVRLSAERRADDGLIRNETRGGTDDALRSLGLRAKLRLSPTNLPDLDIRLGYSRSRRNGGYVSNYVRTDLPDFFDNRRAAGGYPTAGIVHADIATLDISYALSDRVRLSSVTAWNRVAGRSQIDSDGRPIDLSHVDDRFRHRTLTQEMRLNYADDRLSGLIGLWYYRRSGSNLQDSRVSVPTPLATLSALLQASGAPAPTASAIANAYGAAMPAVTIDYVGDLPRRIETVALFSDARLRISERLSLIGGFRYDHERNRSSAQTLATFGGILPDPAAFGPYQGAIPALNAGILGLVAQASSIRAGASRSFNAFLPKAGIAMAWAQHLTTALTVQRAYRSGGTSPNRARAILVPFDPEYSWNYEASLRSQWLDGTLTINANAFHVDWHDQQVRANFGLNIYDYHSVNAGRSHLDGFEVEMQARPLRTVDLSASIGHVRTRFDAFTLPTGSASPVMLTGSQFPYAPRWTLAGGIDARLIPAVAVNLSAHYRSAMFTDVGVTQDQQRVGGRTVVNLALRHEGRGWIATVFARNLLDRHYIQYDYPAVDYAVLGAPRTLGVKLDLEV